MSVPALPADAAWFQKRFRRPLHDLGAAGHDTLRGLLSPTYDAGEVAKYMSSYYDTAAGVAGQVEKFDLTAYYRRLLSEAFARTGRPPPSGADATILELGCGFGSATFPLLALCPGARLAATDLSVPMLAALQTQLLQRGGRERCVLVQLNAEDLDFAPGSFDLVVGAALLHHLLDPGAMLRALYPLLRPGGAAIFFEPFELGMDVVGLIYCAALRDPRSWLLWPPYRRYLAHCVRVWGLNRNPNKRDPYFAGQDDKWMFARADVARWATAAGFAGCLVYPLDTSPRPFAGLIKIHLAGNGITRMPGWFWRLVDEFEASFTEAVKPELLTEGAIVLTRAPTP